MAKKDAKALATRPAIDSEIVKRIDAVVAEAGLLQVADSGHVERALGLAWGIEQLEELIDDTMLAQLTRLQGTTLGFLTDKDDDDAEYPKHIVKRCVVEALLRGLHVVGNEFNIIAGRVYITRWGFGRQVRQYPGLTDLVLINGPPVLHGEKGALIPFRAMWNLNGEAQEMVRERETELVDGDDGKKIEKVVYDHRICVKVNARMGADAIIGKATRKMLAAIYDQISGAAVPMPEGDATDSVAVDVVNGVEVIEREPEPTRASELKTQLQGSLAAEQAKKREGSLIDELDEMAAAQAAEGSAA
jgi:hypothetical protein